MKRFALLAVLLGLGFVAGCDKPKPAPVTPVAPPAGGATDKAATTTDDATPAAKPADKADDMPEDEKDK
jgi:hypothetical protein